MEKDIFLSPNLKKTPPKLDWKHGKDLIQQPQAKNRNWKWFPVVEYALTQLNLLCGQGMPLVLLINHRCFAPKTSSTSPSLCQEWITFELLYFMKQVGNNNLFTFKRLFCFCVLRARWT